MSSENICILCTNLIEIEEDDTFYCADCNFRWEYKLKGNSPFLNQLLKLIELYNNNETSIDLVHIALSNWINELDLSIQDSNTRINIPFPSIIKKAIKYSLLSLKDLKNSLENIDIEKIKEFNFQDIIKNDEKVLKVFNQVFKLLNKIQDDKYYILQEYRKEKIEIENIKIEELDYD
ncbi:MAG: hypothetical protein N2485_04030 [bacterium]|nr:hypothetical protein [bacterium]